VPKLSENLDDFSTYLALIVNNFIIIHPNLVYFHNGTPKERIKGKQTELIENITKLG